MPLITGGNDDATGSRSRCDPAAGDVDHAGIGGAPGNATADIIRGAIGVSGRSGELRGTAYIHRGLGRRDGERGQGLRLAKRGMEEAGEQQKWQAADGPQ